MVTCVCVCAQRVPKIISISFHLQVRGIDALDIHPTLTADGDAIRQVKQLNLKYRNLLVLQYSVLYHISARDNDVALSF